MALAMSEGVAAVAALAYNFDMTLACPPEEIVSELYFTTKANKMPIRLQVRSVEGAKPSSALFTITSIKA
jgi:hypothetical protein